MRNNINNIIRLIPKLDDIRHGRFVLNRINAHTMIFKVMVFSPLLMMLLLYGCSNTAGPGNDTLPSYTISFVLDEPGHVKLWLENAYQTTVITLVDEEREAGAHQVSFEMIDSDGNILPAGLYTYFLKTDSFSVSRALILR